VNPLSAGVYLDRALELMHTHAIYTPAAGWDALSAKARAMAERAKTLSDAYGAIEYAIAQLQRAGDLHASFTNALTAKLEHQSGAPSASTPPPAVSLVAPGLGSITLPAIGSRPRSSDARHYMSSALSALASLEKTKHPCGWVIDLRANSGGDVWPMLLSVGPILGGGRLIGFTDKNGSAQTTVSYRQGTLSGGGYAARAPLTIGDFAPPPAVAVLTGPLTLSSGEAVAIAFRGRPLTRSFGSRTGGATNSPHAYHLADGAIIGFSTQWDKDRRDRVYRHALTPDTLVPTRAGQDDTLRAATEWLASTATCTHHN